MFIISHNTPKVYEWTNDPREVSFFSLYTCDSKLLAFPSLPPSSKPNCALQFLFDFRFLVNLTEEEMEFEDQEEQEEELGMGPAPSYDSLGNPTRLKMPGAGGAGEVMVLQPARNSNSKARYRECLKNHAVSIGGHALDGCGEFLPAGAEGTLDALKCAACNCHRNFHRKETDTIGLGEPYLLTHHPHPHHHHPQAPPQFSAYCRAAPAGYLHVGGQQRGATLALPSTSGAGGGTQSARDDQEDVSNPSGGGGGEGGSKKRFRSKFTQEQKDKMLGLAERLGWRIQKHDEAVVQQFCNESGVKRHVLKVWMHNNKHTLGKKP